MKNLLILVALLTLFSCQKESDIIDSGILNQNEILIFNSYEEVQLQIDYLQGLSKSEIKDWEKSKGFISYNTTCKTVYDKIAGLDFDNQEEAIQKILENYVFIKLTLNEEGEYEAEPNYTDSYHGYLANENGIFMIGDEVCKVFDVGIVKINEENIVAISTLEKDFLEGNPDGDFTILYQESTLNSNTHYKKDNTYDEGRSATKISNTREVDGKLRRVKLEIDLIKEVYDMGVGLIAYNVFKTTITPQKRVALIWWNYEATIYGNLYARLDYEDASYNWTHYDIYVIADGEVDDKLIGKPIYYEPEYSNQDYHFGGYDCEAWTNHTTSSKKAELTKNTNIIDYNTDNIWPE